MGGAGPDAAGRAPAPNNNRANTSNPSNKHGCLIDSEWEYEYDDQETEDFYFTLDLTNHDPNALQAKEIAGTGKTRPVELSLTKAANREDGSNADSQSPSGSNDETPEELPEMQVLDLHTANPYIKYDDIIYSCYWMNELGSQFYVSQPGIVDDPLRPGNVVDVIGLSRARLVGKPVTLKQRPGFTESQLPGNKSSTAIDVDDDVDDAYVDDDQSEARMSGTENYTPGKHLVIERDLITDSASEAQASFLERLSAIKLRRGENDLVPASAVRYYAPPANKAQIREQALAADAEKENAKRAAEAAKASAGPSSKRKRSQSGDAIPHVQAGARSQRPKAGRVSNTDIKNSMGVQESPDNAGVDDADPDDTES